MECHSCGKDIEFEAFDEVNMWTEKRTINFCKSNYCQMLKENICKNISCIVTHYDSNGIEKGQWY
jgi:hypothetical protein